MCTFAKRLKHLRQIDGVTQQELADFLKVGKTTISNYETGYSSPDIETLNKIANFFNTSVDYILGRIETEDYKPQNPIIKDIENLSDESKKELESYIRLLKIKEQIDKYKID